MSNTTRARLDEYLARIAALAPAEWLLVGQLERVLAERTSRATAELIADSIIADGRLALDRWYAVDAVETYATVAEAACIPPSRRKRELMSLARRAARRAVVAVIAEESLRPADVQILCAPLHDVLIHHGVGG